MKIRSGAGWVQKDGATKQLVRSGVAAELRSGSSMWAMRMILPDRRRDLCDMKSRLFLFAGI